MDLKRFHEISQQAGLPVEPYDEWRKTFTDETTRLWPIAKNGEMIGGILFWNNTIHIAVLPEWHGKWLTKSMLKAYPTWMHTVPIIAQVKKGSTKLMQFAEKFGFKPLSDDIQYQYLRKEPPCPQ